MTERVEIPEVERSHPAQKSSRWAKPETTREERTWAAIAHLSTLLTLLVSVATLGIGAIPFAFVPFLIYVAYKDKSDYVTYHAAQAFAMQVVSSAGLFIAFLLVVLVLTIFWTVTGILSAILIGLVLIPVALLLSIVLPLALLVLPFALAGFSLVAGVQTANGGDYEYPYMGRWVADWLDKTKPEVAAE